MTARNRMKVPGYVRAGSRYVSQAFLIGVLTAVFALGVLYMTALHPMVMGIWYAYQELPEFSVDSPYLAGFNGRARLLLTDGTLLYEGQINGAVIGGEGKLYQNGALLYEGGFAENQYNGLGTLYTPDGAVAYAGGFAGNAYQGTGTLYYQEDGKPFQYTGAFEAGERTGDGGLYCDDSLVYRGEFANGVFEGFGKAYAGKLLVYEGMFLAGLYNGEGKLYDAYRLVYDGAFQDGLYHGYGKEYAGGSLAYEGHFDLGVYGGEGTLFDADGQLLYAGGFENGLYQGEGVMHAGGKPSYEGGFRSGHYAGGGKLYNAEGYLLYEGEFADGLYDGEGTEYHPVTGHPLFQGRYHEGKRMEAGTTFDENGVPVIVPVRRLNPLTLLNATYDEALTALIQDGIAYKEQALGEQNLVIDDASAVLYLFQWDAGGAEKRLTEIYLCGLAAAGGFVVGGSIGEACGEPGADSGQAGVFAQKLSDAYWNRETQESARASFELVNEDQRITVVYERDTEENSRIVYLKVSLTESLDAPAKE